MQTVTVSLELPRDILAALNVPEVGLSGRLRELIALELVREGSISTGKAAELLGWTKAEFVALMARHGVSYFTESTEEVSAQVDRVEKRLAESAR